MKIAIICSYDFSITWSLEIFVKKLLLENEVTAICDIQDDYEYGYYIENAKRWGVKHKHVKTYRFISPYQDLKYLYTLYRILHNEHFDMVINIASKPNVYGSIAAKLAGVKNIICSGWGLGLLFAETKEIKKLFLRFIANTLYKIAFSFSRKVWFTNESDLDYFLSKKIINKEKTVLTPGWINTELFSPEAIPENTLKNLKLELGYQDQDEIVIMVARMSWAKGVREFCESADLLRPKYPRLKFLLIGMDDVGSPDSVPLSFLKKYNEKENFNWLGYRVDIKELYAMSDLAVFPSYYREGGWPRGVLEPMAMGKPVITTNTEHCSRAIRDGVNGILVPIKDHFKLSIAIEKIVNDKNFAKEIGKNARQRIKSDMEEELVMSKLIDSIIGAS